MGPVVFTIFILEGWIEIELHNRVLISRLCMFEVGYVQRTRYQDFEVLGYTFYHYVTFYPLTLFVYIERPTSGGINRLQMM